MNEYNLGHPTSAGISNLASIPQPKIFDIPSGVDSGEIVSSQELEHFVTQGFFVKRGLLRDSEAMNQAIELLWSSVPRKILNRNDPSTWVDSPHKKWTEEDVDSVGRLHNGNWKLRSRGSNGLGTESFLIDGIANHPAIVRIGEHLLGSALERVRRVRGVYAVFPKPLNEHWSLGPHADYMASQISIMVLVNDVPPRCGGFTVWPGSHSRLHCCWDTVHGSTMKSKHLKNFAVIRGEILSDTTPVEISGQAGDVVFWHPRILHSAGVNFSAETKHPIVRVIVPCDYQRAGLSYFDDLQFGPGPLYQYWVDTRNFHEDVRATEDNMWSNWNL